MVPSSLFGLRKFSSPRPRSPRARPQQVRFRPLLELLENRLAPATLTVNETGDNYDFTPATSLTGATGSLRGCIVNAADGDTITFANSLAGQTITLTQALNTIYWSYNHNLTIQGPSGGVTISGGGGYFFDGGIALWWNTSNAQGQVSISNVTFTNFVGNSAIELAGVSTSSPLNPDVLTLNSCTFSGNINLYQGAISILSTDTLSLNNCNLWNNSSDLYQNATTVFGGPGGQSIAILGR